MKTLTNPLLTDNFIFKIYIKIYPVINTEIPSFHTYLHGMRPSLLCSVYYADILILKSIQTARNISHLILLYTLYIGLSAVILEHCFL